MTKQGPRKSVDENYWRPRLDVARAFLKASQDGMALHEAGHNASPIASNIVLAAIAYCDSVTGKFNLIINQQDHSGAPRLLREVMQNALPLKQEKTLRRLLANKDDVQYGFRRISAEQVQLSLADLE